MRILFLPFCISINCASLLGKEISGTCISISDGDTVTVLTTNERKEKEQHKIRLYGIDAPEKKQPYGQKSRQYLSNLIYGKEIQVVWSSKDKYRRIIGKIYLDGLYINLHMVEKGYAWHYTHFCKEQNFFYAEQHARSKRSGLWDDLSTIAPWEFKSKKKNVSLSI